VIDAGGKREEPFEGIGDVGFDILRRHTRVKRRHHNFGQIDGREKIDGHVRQTGSPDDHEGQAEHDDEVRIPNRES